MRKINLYAAAAFLILTGCGVWAALSSHAQVEAATLADRIDPMQITMNARDLPSEEFTDYTFVFNH